MKSIPNKNLLSNDETLPFSNDEISRITKEENFHNRSQMNRSISYLKSQSNSAINRNSNQQNFSFIDKHKINEQIDEIKIDYVDSNSKNESWSHIPSKYEKNDNDYNRKFSLNI